MTRGGTATVVIEQPSLPIPTAQVGPRHEMIAAVCDELDRLGVQRVTILVAGGLFRRTTPREIGLLVPPEFRRRFKGRVLVHDAESEDLVELGVTGNVTLRVNRALVETDLVVTATAAETVLNGGPAALLSASGRDSLRAAGALSLLETSASQGWRLAVEIERRLAERVADHRRLARPQPTASVRPVRRLPARPAAVERLLGSRARRLFQLAPGRVRQRALERLPREQTASAVFGGTPSVAHAEALLRGTVFKGIDLDEPVDALVIGIPPTTPFMPRERPNPVSAAYLGLGLALRLWRNRPPIVPGGTAILVHPFQRRFPRPTQLPYRALFFDPRTAGDIGAMRDAEAAATNDAARDRGLSRGTRLPPAAAVRRVERLRRLRPPSRSGADRRLPRRARSQAARLRARARARRRARDGARPRCEAHRLPAGAAVRPDRGRRGQPVT